MSVCLETATADLYLPALCFTRVISRGILVSLSSLYQQLLELLRPVADAQPMPFLTDFTLPADMLQFLGPSDASLLTKLAKAKEIKKKKNEQQKKDKNQGAARKVKEDVGVTVERGV